MEKEKIQQFFEIINGISEAEWQTLKERTDWIYRRASLDTVPNFDKKMLRYYTEQTDKEFAIVRKLYSDPK